MRWATLLLRPGARVPVDGVVVSGSTGMDESTLTGESMPVMKEAGDPVYAATLNTTGSSSVPRHQGGDDTALAQIIRLVEEAQGSGAPIARLADTVSGIFVPVVFAIALLSGIAWLIATRTLTLPSGSLSRCWSSPAPVPWGWPLPLPSWWAPARPSTAS